MNLSSPTLPAARPLDTERAALVKLLADDDPAVYQVIREKILSFGPESSDWLRAHALSSDPVLRRHVLEIIRYFERQQADNRFLSFCLKNGEDFDTETGAWLLAQTSYPNINIEAYQAILDGYAADLRERVQEESAAEKILGSLNKYLYEELGFAGNVGNYYDPENSYLNRVLDRRTGNPITLSLCYMLIARRLHLPVIGIGMPGHFICRYQSASGEFFIDPFNRGQLLSKADCIQYLQRGHYTLNEDFLSPIRARRMFLRICTNLHQIYTELGRTEDVTRFQRYLVALAR